MRNLLCLGPLLQKIGQDILIEKVPCGGGGEREQDGHDAQKIPAPFTESRGESQHTQGGARDTGSPCASGENGKAGAGAHDQCVADHLHSPPEALPDRMDRIGGTVDQGRGAVAGLIGVDRPGNALPDGQGNHGASKAAHGSRAGKGTLEDLGKHGGHIGDIHEKNDDGCQQIGSAHDGNQLFCYSADGVFAPDQQVYNEQHINDHNGHQI